MRQNLGLDIAVFKDFDAVHACLSASASEGRRLPIRERSSAAAAVMQLSFQRRRHAARWLRVVARRRAAGTRGRAREPAEIAAAELFL